MTLHEYLDNEAGKNENDRISYLAGAIKIALIDRCANFGRELQHRNDAAVLEKLLNDNDAMSEFGDIIRDTQIDQFYIEVAKKMLGSDSYDLLNLRTSVMEYLKAHFVKQEV